METLCEGIDHCLRQARSDDLPAIKKLLEDSGLTAHGIEGKLDSFFIAEKDVIIGVVGMEISNHKGLLRSFAVAHSYRKLGIAKKLLTQSLYLANERGLATIYLLTDTAEAYFARHGFTKIERTEIPGALLTNSGLGCVCPCCSAAMKLAIGDEPG